MRVVISGTIAVFPWQWKQIQLTLISVFSQTRYVWEKASLCPPSIKAWSLPLLNMLIHSVVPLLFLPAHETPTAPLSPSQVGVKGDLGSLQLRLGGPGLHPLVDYVWRREEGEGEVHHIILLTIPVPYGERTGLSSGTVSGVAGPACLSSQGTFSLSSTPHTLMWAHWCRKDGGLFVSLLQSPPDYNLIYSWWTLLTTGAWTVVRRKKWMRIDAAKCPLRLNLVFNFILQN